MKAEATILVDGHVHLYPIHDRGSGLDAAVSAFGTARRSHDLGVPGHDCLMIVDPERGDAFAALQELGAKGWRIGPSGSLALEATRDDGATLLLVAGRQIRTESGLEVLAFFTSRHVGDGRSLPRSVEAVLSVGAVPVLPWGFGKWWGRRGRQVARLLESSLGPRVLVADTATRPGLLPTPHALRLARERGVPVLAGTDPLPFPGEERRIARYGFAIDGELNGEDPGETLKRRLLDDETVPQIYGSRESTWTALRLQLAMQWRRFRSTHHVPPRGS